MKRSSPLSKHSQLPRGRQFNESRISQWDVLWRAEHNVCICRVVTRSKNFKKRSERFPLTSGTQNPSEVVIGRILSFIKHFRLFKKRPPSLKLFRMPLSAYSLLLLISYWQFTRTLASDWPHGVQSFKLLTFYPQQKELDVIRDAIVKWTKNGKLVKEYEKSLPYCRRAFWEGERIFYDPRIVSDQKTQTPDSVARRST